LQEATGGPLEAVAGRLLAVGGTLRPLAVARLRGGILRDDGWARLPSQPAVITSTVDQLGSRLLFRGYGRSHLTAPIFAGLAAHDSLILLDEAHCSVPFLQTLRCVERYRGRDWAEEPIETPFAFSILSATPPSDLRPESVFPGAERERALDHPVLDARMRASKPAKLVPPLKAKNSSTVDALVEAAVNRACEYVNDGNKKRVAVIVNRVRTAIGIATALKDRLKESADTVLLTGRLRPYERDRLVERWKPFLRADEPDDPDRPIVLVATQAIEVGADFSFDALVSEIASLDALRQRFGRLSRMGSANPAPAAILAREEDVKDGASDPIYGTSIVATWRLLQERATAERTLDFGIKALDAVLSEIDDLSPYLAPTPRAPTLLPAHLDVLCQTGPIARPEPEIQLFLHGVDRGAPEARVVWRADLTPENSGAWKESVALCPPSTGEALAVPLYRLRQWLANAGGDGDVGDVEGVPERRDQAEEKIRPALVWAGRDRSRLVQKAAGLRPNDLIVVPADYGMIPMGQTEPERALGRRRLDLWEVARQASGRAPAMRLHRAVLEPWVGCPVVRDLLDVAADPACDRDELRDAVDAVLAYEGEGDEEPAGLPEWLKELLGEVQSGLVEQHPDGGLILFQRHSPAKPDEEPDLFADDDDLLSASGKEVSLAVHSASVWRATRKIAERCLAHDLMEALSTAAYWHDAGKLDERFQLVLRQGDELAVIAGEPLAKSAGIPASPARRRAIREASRLPEDFRHEMLSLQLAERYARLPEERERADLLLHLVASHHGHARPFAPISIDPDPPEIRGCHGGQAVELSADDRRRLRPAHGISSGIADRFWRLNRRYGWWGLAYLEAILRLGDWYGSHHVVDDAGDAPVEGSSKRRAAGQEDRPAAPVVLSGIDGANPLGFLSGLGVLCVLRAAGESEARLHWQRSATWQPVLTGIAPGSPVRSTRERRQSLEDAVASVVAEALRGDDVPPEAEQQRREAQKRYDAAKKAIKDKLQELKKRGLKGKERRTAIDAEVTPLQLEEEQRRVERQAALRQAVPRPELAVGKHIDCSIEEFREHVEAFLNGAGTAQREALDFLAAFASDGNLHESDTKRVTGILASTPFCFISGSGHQYFLDTVRQLMAEVNEERVRSVLFEPWQYRDEKLSMRWD
ncbi:MAG TPA: type I-U CRISPR-associated helicase/endonuclease Cas3, partial [Polyangiaceae bacterium]|nr:type I-U CRISPR-associated helicase/endonuclease Cas3 [Polyangiaceae bacterium]